MIERPPAGERIRQTMIYHRREAGITSQRQMAELMGCSMATVQRLESPDAREWARITLYWTTIENFKKENPNHE